MTDGQKKKRKIRSGKKWKLKRLAEKKRAGGLDEITLKPLRKGWQLHHENLDESHYGDFDNNNFLCCNKKTHDFIHWLYMYYIDDPYILVRVKKVLQKMQALNGNLARMG